MKTRNATKKLNSTCKSDITLDRNRHDSQSEWMQAADKAGTKIAYHQKRIRLLEEARRTFVKYAQEGQKWPQRAHRESSCAET